MGNTLPKHQFYFKKDYYFVTMVLNNLDYNIDEYGQLNFYAKDKNNNPITFSNCPDWHGLRGSIPISNCERLTALRNEFKVLIHYGKDISPYIIAFSEDIKKDLSLKLPIEYRISDRNNLKTTIERPHFISFTDKGALWDTHLVQVTGIDSKEDLIIPKDIYESMIRELANATSIEIFHDNKNNVGWLNINF